MIEVIKHGNYVHVYKIKHLIKKFENQTNNYI